MESAEKVSGTQLCLLMFSFIAPTVILVIPGLMSSLAKQDSWLTILPTLLIGALNIGIMLTLSKRYPGMTIIQYSAHIIGKWPAKLLSCYLIYVWFNFDFIILNQHIQFINTVFLMKTPSVVISLTLAIFCCIAVYMGIEAIARCNEYLALLNIVLLIPLLFLMLAESDPERLRPVMGNGIVPVFQASVFPIAYITQFFTLGWLLPYLNQPKQAAKASFLSLGIISGLLCITLLPLIMVFGPLTEKLTFPVLSVIQYIGIKGSFERLEALAVAIWVMSCFISGNHIRTFRAVDLRKWRIRLILYEFFDRTRVKNAIYSYGAQPAPNLLDYLTVRNTLKIRHDDLRMGQLSQRNAFRL